ncbi:MAG TPA: universal stress protein [Polyangia bacterium]|jgi:nucleotide-binding universal stress UspA family protein|nr:universal stress protein [Polyangia bacterium]
MKPKILVPFDFSDMAERALAWAADLQRTTSAPALHIVHAISSRPSGATDVPVERLLPDEDEIAELERAMLDQARRAEASATAAVWIRASKVGDIILDAAASEKADLVVMGSHGRTGVKRLLLGSVAEHVLRHAKCPVVTIHSPNGHAK